MNEPVRRDDGERAGVPLPARVDPRGVPGEHSGREAFLVVLAVVLALLALTFTLGWIVFHRLTS